MELKKKIEVLAMIAEDMKKDAKEFDGKPFNGRTVAEYFGKHGAAIAALVNIIRASLEEKEVTEHTSVNILSKQLKYDRIGEE